MPTTYGASAPYWLKKWFLSEPFRNGLDAIPQNASAIDLGCGGGRVSLYLVNRGIDVCGIDADATLISDLSIKYPTLRWVCGDAENEAWPPADWIVSNVCIRKDQCRLEKILPKMEGKSLLLRIQGAKDLGRFITDTPCYSQEELRRLVPGCQIEVEAYQQRFTSGNYLRESICKIGMTPNSEANGEKPINANREYLLLRRG